MKKMLFLAAVSAIALTSCVNEENFEGPKPQAQVMRFDAPVMKQTRANVKGEIQGHLYDKAENFKVFCKIYEGPFTGWESATDYFKTEGDVAKNEGGESSYWATESEYYWPEAQHNLAFAAYSPAVLPTAPTSIEHTENGLQIKGFQTEAEADSLYDLMYSDRILGRNRTNNGSVAVPLIFRHALSSIVFSSEKEDDKAQYTIKTATLTGDFVQKADFNQNITAASDLKGTALWENLVEATSSITYSPAFNAFDVTTTPTKFTEKASALLLIPQDVPANAAVTITYTKKVTKSDGTINSTENTATIKLADFRQAGGEAITTWEMGKRYIYRISFGQNKKIYFEPKTEDWVEVPTLIYVIQ